MLKPIKTAKLKTVGLGIRFARGIMEHAAAVESYDLSESELVFAMGAARERDDLMSVLELLDEVLDLIKRGFDRRADFLAIRIINNVGIMLRRGGFSREYSNVLEIYNKISSVVEGKTEIFNYSECRGEIHKQISLLRAEQTKHTPGGGHENGIGNGNISRLSGRARALKNFKTVSERGTLTLNTLNSGMLQITSRNHELLKMIKLDKTFMELSLKNIENIRRRTERTASVQRFFGALTEEQIELLERFVADENLFSELREKSSGVHDLKYLLESSSEKSLSEFFGTLRQRIEERSALISEQVSERSYFDSAEKMKEFFVGARRGEIERLIKELDKDRLHRGEARTLTDALRLYEAETEKRRIADERITELYRIAEDALRHRIGAENFSEERFITALGASRELKKVFADYAWENYRSDETVKRYAEYTKNTVIASGDKSFGVEQDALRAEFRVSESAAPGVNGESEISAVGKASGNGAVSDNGGLTVSGGSAAGNETAAYGAGSADDGMTKERFVDFLINSGELNLKFSESVKNSFLNASSDVAAAFAEYLVTTVREDSFAYFSEQVRSLAEKAENILYYEGSDIEEKSAETFSLIYSAWNECAPQLSELYASFTQSRADHDEILRLYSYLPKNNYTAVSEFLEAAAQGDAYFINLSNDFLKQSAVILNKAGGSLDGTRKNSEYTFYDALSDMSENTLNLLLPLAGIRGGSDYNVFAGNNAAIAADDKTADVTVIGGNNDDGAHINGTSAYPAEYNTLVEQASAFVVSAAFAEYLSSTVRGDDAAHYNERIHTIADRVEAILRSEQTDIREKSAEALTLIYNEWNGGSPQLSELYASFTESCDDREEILRLYSRLSKNDLADISNILNYAAHGETNSFSFNSNFSKQLEKLFENMRGLPNITSAKNGNEYDFRGAPSGVFENAPDLILKEASADPRITEDLYQRLVFAEKAGGLRALLPSAPSRAERRVYNITQSGKSIVTDRTFYNALAAFNGAAENNTTDSVMNNVISEVVYSALTPREYFFTWESGSVTLFNRAAANKTHIRTNGFFERHNAAALTLSERISEKFSAENQRSDYNTAAELFYTDEYFERSGAGVSAPVNYAVPAAVASGGSDEVSEKLGDIRGAIESISAEIVGIKQREEDLSREFVTKSEHKVFERELKSSIERDIYLAGKRHGIY